jgi:hypothetical protein
VLSPADLALLDSLLDALDRLYDRATTAVDVRALLFATGKELGDPAFVEVVAAAKAAMDVVVRSRLDPDEENKQALIATGELRFRIADLP